MSFDWDNLPPEAQERMQRAREQAMEPGRDLHSSGVAPTIEREREAESQLSQREQLDAISSQLPTLESRNVSEGEFYNELKYSDQNNAMRILDDSILQQRSAQEPTPVADSYPSMAEAPPEVQAEYMAHLEQIEAEKTPEQKAHEQAQYDAFNDERQQEHLAQLAAEREDREIDDDD